MSTAAIADMVDGAAPPIGAAIEILPDILDAVGVAPDQAGDDVIGEVARDAEFAAR
ncbi:MAG: hypothetical protein WDN08_08345 [Rhizomicrobium sp.]